MNLHPNLDHVAAVTGQAILAGVSTKEDKKEAETLIRKALGILQDNGVYAAMLFLLSRAEQDPIAEDLATKLLAVCEQVTGATSGKKQVKRLEYLTTHVTSDLQTLLLVKQLWEQTLIYARYAAKF